MHDPSETVTIQRKEKDGTHTTLSKPVAISTYNHNMAGVDKGDQLRGYYRLRLKCMNNYKYIFFFLFDTAIVDAFILYHNYSNSPTLTQKEFQLPRHRNS